MAEGKKVVIKINYDKNASDVKVSPPTTVTVWHKQRIASALVLLAILVVSGIYGLSGWHAAKQNEGEPSVPLGDKAGGAKEVMSSSQVSPYAEAASHVGRDKTESASSEAKREFAIIFDKSVVRASLNSALKDNEPYQLLKSPIKLTENQKIELFYFTELKGIKHKVFYHNWSKDGMPVYKKQLLVQRKHLKVNSAKLFSVKDKGNWQIQLVDKTGKVFSEVNFVVE